MQIRSASRHENGLISVVYSDGLTLQVPDDLSNRHRGDLHVWEQAGNSIATIYPELDDVKAEYRLRVDADAESCRLRYITPGAGMAMIYQEKFAQAQAVAAMGAAAADALTQAEREAQFPTLSASVGLEAQTLSACADLVLAKYAAFAQLSLVIERTRLQGKQAISAASDGAAVVAAYEALTWPTP